MLLRRLDPRAATLVRLAGLVLIGWSVFHATHHPDVHGRGLVVSVLFAASAIAWLWWTAQPLDQDTITPDLWVSPAEPIAWCRLEEVGEDWLMVRVPGGLAVSLPRRLAPGQPWVGIVEWAVEATTVHRGIRTYEATGFAQFSLDQFTNEQQV